MTADEAWAICEAAGFVVLGPGKSIDFTPMGKALLAKPDVGYGEWGRPWLIRIVEAARAAPSAVN
jgi:hypothetical protein